MRMGMAVAGKEELAPEDIHTMLAAGLDGVMQRGKAEVGDKTMVDTLAPAIRTLGDALTAGHHFDDALDRMVAAAEEGMTSTIPLVARKGRASYLGERSAGHQDPGATSAYLILAALRDTLTEDG